MAKRYRIADYLTVEQKRRALAHIYENHWRRGEGPRDENNYCPLGAALFYPNAVWTESAPSQAAVADAITSTSNITDVDTWDEIWTAAAEFIDDWDGNLIFNLAEALGVTV